MSEHFSFSSTYCMFHVEGAGGEFACRCSEYLPCALCFEDSSAWLSNAWLPKARGSGIICSVLQKQGLITQGGCIRCWGEMGVDLAGHGWATLGSE